ncbi:MAG: hypothetical protein HRU48_16540, partial [Vibrio sp.]|nr:hypothetical protein [Vibrio sp.]
MHKYFKTLFTTVTLPALLLSTGCNSESENNPPPSDKSDSNLTSSSEVERDPTSAFNLISISPSVIDKTTTFTWQAAENATEYSVCRKDISKPKYCDVLATSTTNNAIVNGLDVIKSLTSEYFVIAKGVSGEKSSNEMSLTSQELTPLIQYLKASNTEEDASFGDSIVLSSDGNTLAVGSPREGGTSGAVYLFRYSASTWTQQAYIKGSNTEAGDGFGRGVALSSDGNTLAIGA